MKKTLLFVILFLSFQPLFSQENIVKLKSGSIILNTESDINLSADKNYYLASFSEIPTQNQQQKIVENGMNILEYIPTNTFVVNITNTFNVDIAKEYGLISLISINEKHKLDPKIQNSTFPEWAVKGNKLSVKVLLYKDANLDALKNEFILRKFRIDNIVKSSNSITVTIPKSKLKSIAKMNDVWYIEPIDPPSVKENKTGRTLHRSNVINTNYANGRHYDGSGINIMMQDDGFIGPHIDYQGRIDDSNCIGCSTNPSDDHGDHVAGTIMGAGNLDPTAAGMSNASFLYVYSSTNNNYYDVPTLYQNNDVVITSKSYGNGCNAGYTSLSMELDAQIQAHPSLIHVFSAGNSGGSDCGYGAGSGWGNITGGHKQGKNVLAVANLNIIGNLSSSSSRGPAADGRIKPDIGAKGTSVTSTVPSQDYASFTGTSMACPGIAGVLGQLYQAYKELNGGVNPNSALMKNILLNTADDKGNVGPDFKNGWGEVNAFQAIKVLENNQYLSSSISQGVNNMHNIIIPSGVKQANIMVYWHDKEGSVNAAPALVNDIDIALYDNLQNLAGQSWVLDPTPNSSSLNATATYGNDHLNNVEQITINNPAAGTYQLSVDGYAIPFGVQEYWVTYQFITEDIKLTYPIGGEGIVAGDVELIRWDASEGSTPFTIEYTTDNTTWNVISNNVSANNAYYYWTVPNGIITDNAKVRISRNGFSDESTETFTIVDVPQNINVNWICPDSIYISWDPVNGATSYEVSMLGNMYMDSMTTTTSTSALILNPNPANVNSWFSVCAKVNNSKGRRALAVNAQSLSNGCLAPPIASFTSDATSSCSGVINFTDNSFNQPSSWLWDFGDGNTSNQQNPTHTYAQQGTYDVSLYISNSLGQDTITYSSYITVVYNSSPTTYNDTACTIPSSFHLGASSSNTKWYTDTLGSAPVHTGMYYNTPQLNSTTTFYVKEFGGASVFGGPANNSIGGGGYYNNDRHLFIDCYTPSTLVSVDVYGGTAQNITFELRDNNSQIIQDTTIFVQLGLNTLYLDFDMPVMNDLELGISGGGANLYRNSSGASYPYPIGNIASITGHNSPNSTYYHYFFYNLQMQENCVTNYAAVTGHIIPGQVTYSNQSVAICQGDTYTIGNSAYIAPGFYTDTIPNTGGCDSVVSTNLTVYPSSQVINNVSICNGDAYTVGDNTYTTAGTYTDIFTNQMGCDSICITNLSVVNINPTISSAGSSLQVTASSGLAPFTYLWSTGETTQTIIPQINGVYTVVVTDANGCVSNQASFTVNNLPTTINNLSSNLSIYPNPTSGILNISFSQVDSEDIDIKILNEIGEVVFAESLGDFRGDYNKQVDMSNFAKGVYMFKLINNKNVAIYKVVLQ